MSNVKGLLNCLVRFKVTSLRDLAGMAGKRSASPNLFDTEGWPEVKNPKLVRKVKKNMEHQTMEGKTLEKNLVEENIETKKTIAKGCSDCDVLNNSVGDFDKRQDLFSQRIILYDAIWRQTPYTKDFDIGSQRFATSEMFKLVLYPKTVDTGIT
ncbi:hypothetical protein ACJJTC_017850 [Scirpophaga incertulas]